MLRQTGIHRVQPLTPESSASEVEMAIEKLKHHKSLSTDQIPEELSKAGGITIHSEIYKLFNTIWNKEELPQGWKDSIIVPFYKKEDKTDCSNYRSISLLSNTCKMLSIILPSRLTPYGEEIYGGSSVCILMQKVNY